jgi:CheY-like chemotaxis protein
VFCIDDHPPFRAAVRELIQGTPGFTQVGEAGSAEDGIAQQASLRPDLVLIDVRLPGMDGFAAAASIAERRRDLVVLLMSADPIVPPTDYCPRGAEISFAAKQDLCPRLLLDLWHGRRTR